MDTGDEQVQPGDDLIGNIQSAVEIADIGFSADEDAHVRVQLLQLGRLALDIQVGPGILDANHRRQRAVFSYSYFLQALLMSGRHNLMHILTAITEMGMGMIISIKAHHITCFM